MNDILTTQTLPNELTARPEWVDKDGSLQVLLRDFGTIWAGSLDGETIESVTQAQIDFILSLPDGLISLGSPYQHYKHNPESGNWHEYLPLAVALLIQDGNNIACVVYQGTQGGQIWLRALRQEDADLIKSNGDEPTPWNGGTGVQNGVTVPKFTQVVSE